ncbi:MAG: enoyl-CoA hydratase/isomerase family protein, partial [Frankiales bacterium]|nr:enoyl-CoA hydratase/isomerase family protein [Frankiales bacterium]
LLGKPLSATEAERWGMVNRVVPAADFAATLREWALEVASGPTVRMGHIKGQLNSSFEAGMLASFKEEATLLGIGGGEDGHEAMQAYIERRDPNFTGR